MRSRNKDYYRRDYYDVVTQINCVGVTDAIREKWRGYWEEYDTDLALPSGNVAGALYVGWNIAMKDKDYEKALELLTLLLNDPRFQSLDSITKMANRLLYAETLVCLDSIDLAVQEYERILQEPELATPNRSQKTYRFMLVNSITSCCVRKIQSGKELDMVPDAFAHLIIKITTLAKAPKKRNSGNTQTPALPTDFDRLDQYLSAMAQEIWTRSPAQIS